MPTKADYETRIAALEKEVVDQRKRIEELERIVNRTLPPNAKLGPHKIVELNQ